MTDGLERALAGHHRFETDVTGYVPTNIIFDARVSVEDGALRVENQVPTLDAVVAGETVAPVVEDGWFETFERRVEDVGGVTKADDVAVIGVDRSDETITVESELQATPGTAGGDALAVVNYVEGTWVEGIIPGYDYVDSVEAVRARARQTAQER